MVRRDECHNSIPLPDFELPLIFGLLIAMVLEEKSGAYFLPAWAISWSSPKHTHKFSVWMFSAFRTALCWNHDCFKKPKSKESRTIEIEVLVFYIIIDTTYMANPSFTCFTPTTPTTNLETTLLPIFNFSQYCPDETQVKYKNKFIMESYFYLQCVAQNVNSGNWLLAE